MEAEETRKPPFRSLAAELDRAEKVADNAVGGPTEEMVANVRAAEGEMGSVRPKSLGDYRWLTRRLARAIDHGWTRDAAAFLLRLAM